MRALERTLFVIAAVALAWYAGVTIDAAREQAALSRELESSRVAPATVSDAGAHAAVPLAPHSMVGRIEIARLRLSTVAREGVDTRTLRASAGHVPGTALPGASGNAAFAAHRDTFFAALKDVRTGDDIRVTTPGGDFHYLVTATRIVDPGEVSVLEPTHDATLTLVTCYPFDYFGSAPQRFVVRARLVSGAP